MLWPDQRCSDQVRELAAYADGVARIAGRPLSTLSWLPRLRWLRANAPTVVREAVWWLPVKDVLRLHLTGQVATDSYDAHGTGLLDQATGGWSQELLGLAGVCPERMPPIRRPDDIAGQVTPAAAATSGLCPGTPVVVGSGDWFSTLVGSGCFLPRRTCFYLGSAGILGSFTSETELDRLGTTRYFGSVTSTGTALQWIRGLLYEGDGGGASPVSYALVCADGERSEPGARGLLFLPHLMGERGGRMRPGARGVLYGLTLAHDRHDVVRAVLEGAAMWLRATCEPQLAGVDTGDLVVFGGGAGSALWRQICAAVFERRLLVPQNAEGAGLGVAMMAAVGCGMGGYAELARRWVRISSTETPDPQLVKTYRDLYHDFRELESTVARLS
jgi:xylulokinase